MRQWKVVCEEDGGGRQRESETHKKGEEIYKKARDV